MLKYFDPAEETVIHTDTSLKSRSAVVLQNGQPVCNASKALTETEQKYSNIDGEALGLARGLERFQLFMANRTLPKQTNNNNNFISVAHISWAHGATGSDLHKETIQLPKDLYWEHLNMT